MVGGGILGVVIERFAYRPLRNAPRIAPLISALGVSFFLQNSVLLLWGADFRSYETFDLVDPFKGIHWGVLDVWLIRLVVVGTDGRPAGSLDAFETFREQAAALAEGGVDIFAVETMMFPQEATAAIQACKAVSDLPVMATMFFQYEEIHDRDRTMWGESPADVARTLLARSGGLDRLESAPACELASVPGVGAAKAASLIAQGFAEMVEAAAVAPAPSRRRRS